MPLLNLIGGLDVPTSGSICVGGHHLEQMSEAQRTCWRSRHIGFVFQSYNLIPQLTVLENIDVPLYYCGQITAADRQR